MSDYELMNEIYDNDEKEAKELINEYEILTLLEEEEEAKEHSFDENSSEEGYY